MHDLEFWCGIWSHDRPSYYRFRSLTGETDLSHSTLPRVVRFNEVAFTPSIELFHDVMVVAVVRD